MPGDGAADRLAPQAWSPPGHRGEAELDRILAFRAERAIRHFERRARSGTERQCPICGYRGRFSPVRHKPEIWCPQCDSRPRHRLIKLWMDRELRIEPGADVIHFAAEPWMKAEFERRGAAYRSADLEPGFDLQLDITAIDLPDACADMVIANHVLEHVDDAAAFRELHRILRADGLAVITVPIVEGWDATYQADGLDEAARAARYGDPDHLRFYGRDFRHLIRSAGFALREFVAEEPDVSSHALHRGERVFIARKERPKGRAAP